MILKAIFKYYIILPKNKNNNIIKIKKQQAIIQFNSIKLINKTYNKK